MTMTAVVRGAQPVQQQRAMTANGAAVTATATMTTAIDAAPTITWLLQQR